MASIAIFLQPLANNFHPAIGASLVFVSFVIHADAITPAKDPHLRRPCLLLVPRDIGD